MQTEFTGQTKLPPLPEAVAVTLTEYFPLRDGEPILRLLSTMPDDLENVFKAMRFGTDSLRKPLEDSMKASPDDLSLRRTVAVQFNYRGKIDHAVKVLSESIYDMPDPPAQLVAELGDHAYFSWSRSEIKNPNLIGGCIELYRRAILIDPENVGIRFKLGRALLDCGRPDEALTQFCAVIDKDPQNGHAHERAAVVFQLQRNYERASKMYLRAGEIFLERGDNELLALECFHLALAADPNLLDEANCGFEKATDAIRNLGRARES